ncbi:MAG: hypothetical protein AAFR53_05310 [Pseudomonadota bacterium]
MSDKPEAIEDKIQLAIDAAAVANDATADLTRVKDKADLATEKLENFVRMVRPLVLGSLLGGGMAALLAAAVYVQAAFELRVSRTAYGEAARELLEALDMQAAAIEATRSAVADLAATDAIDEDMLKMIVADALTATTSEEDAGSLPQMLGALADLTQSQHAETRESLTAALENTQLALTRVIASEPLDLGVEARQALRERPVAVAPEGEPEAARSTSRPMAAPVAQVARPQAPVRRAPAPEPNPFSYP